MRVYFCTQKAGIVHFSGVKINPHQFYKPNKPFLVFPPANRNRQHRDMGVVYGIFRNTSKQEV